jgi:hypothetical protein
MPWKKAKGGFTKADGSGGFVKNPDQYEALRREGKSKESAARITNAQKSKRSK